MFEVLDQANAAREALLGAGFAAADVQMSMTGDEAGAVEGNFVIGNSPPESEGHTYARNYAARPADLCIMRVSAPDQASLARADAILATFGARDGDPAALALQRQR
ncbi:MAG: hypothetical protein M1823_006616 [Watsoniomyces obsoletus]|nr:MAG: hypothetical protein M1823_006616 [Watsoniomyces obsoletus]